MTSKKSSSKMDTFFGKNNVDSSSVELKFERLYRNFEEKICVPKYIILLVLSQIPLSCMQSLIIQ